MRDSDAAAAEAFDSACLNALQDFRETNLSLNGPAFDVALSRLVSLVAIIRRIRPRQTVIDLHKNYIPCLSGCHPQPLAVVFGHAHGRHQRGNLRFRRSLPEFQRLFPDDAACAAYLEKARSSDGFVCPHCQAAGEPFRFANRPGVLRCRKCRRDTGLTVGTVMARSHTPLSVWFWSAHLVVLAKHPACRPCSFGDNLAFRATRRRSKSSTSSARGWCARIRTGSAAGPASTSKSMKPGLAAGRAA